MRQPLVRGCHLVHCQNVPYYYKKNGIAPMVRILSKVTGYKLKEIYELFPSGPGKGACKMAGLPKPTGCV
ncbi:MAG: TusE/DsrC/DsvC family sulfur relay protein [Humidesulfovibrio sp.]|uniref:TusE/DsrC/DsvC family sulfur relay protein n=1 Tax=Humidesulfovibrio sp. TaxID=2910988 RepID=UPI0027FE0EAA|nr:TusE/DsrC/DsvC family sulfur relay protein [Humidesulfovibrio sp.]MDQ7835963.1 TusE/DsrC/DsvC family sulfur relay protein [Humidesulfovibrio sp.]